MVLNSSLVVTVANVSANLCQYIACNPERLPNDQVLHLLFCLPFQHARRVALSFWACLLFPAGDESTSASSSSFSSSSYGSDSDLSSRDREDLHSD